MTHELPTESDLLVKYSRRSRWVALTLLVLLAGYALVLNIFPESEAAALASRLFLLLPIGLVLALGTLRASLQGARANPAGAPMKAILNDELRQQSLSRAYRNGLMAVLVAQPLLALLLALVAVAHPVALMASLTALAGVCAVLGSQLAYDR